VLRFAEETLNPVKANHFERSAGCGSAVRPFGHLYCSNTPWWIAIALSIYQT
jgi:hypothetical protein